MRVAFDAVALSAYLYPKAKYPVAIDRVPERLKLLVEELEAANAKIIIPTPVLCEFLVLAGDDGPQYLAELHTSDVFKVEPFDEASAIEAAARLRKDLDDDNKRLGTKQRWQVCKVDREFVAVAKVHGVTCIYSDDSHIRKLGNVIGIKVKGIADLPAPPLIAHQSKLFTTKEDDEASSTEPEHLAEQSHATGSVKASELSPAPPSDLPVDQEQPPLDSSQTAVPRPPLKQ